MQNINDDVKDEDEVDQINDKDNKRKRSMRKFVNNTGSNRRNNKGNGNGNDNDNDNDEDGDNNNNNNMNYNSKKKRNEGQLVNSKSKRRGQGFSYYSRNQAAHRFARVNRIALITANRSVNENEKHLHSASPASSQEEVYKLNIFLRYNGMLLPFMFLPF